MEYSKSELITSYSKETNLRIREWLLLIKVQDDNVIASYAAAAA